MTRRPSFAEPQPSRRHALGLLGAVFVGAASGSLGTAAAARAGAADTPADLLPGGEFDRFVAQRAEADQFSGTVLLAHRGHPVLTRSFGMADKTRATPNRHDTIFNLASLTKSFTALAIALLVQDGTVHLYETLGTYLDGFSVEMKKVTIHQLLTHTAGMRNYSQTEAFRQGLKQWTTTAEMMDGVMDIIRATEVQPDPAPGLRHSYSNSGYFVLGAIAARVSGQPYHDYIRRHVLAPAGMRRSDLYTRPQVITNPDIARPYWTMPPDGPRVDFTTSEYFGFVGGPSEGIYSTAPELLRFARVLSSGRLLDTAYADLFTSGKFPLSPQDRPVTPAQARFYGYGFRVTVSGGQLLVGHSGSGPGTATNIDIYPHQDWAAIILSNYDTTIEPIVQKGRELISRQTSQRHGR